MKVYIAGKITGDRKYRRKFLDVAKRFQEQFDVPLNPAVLPDGLEEADYMRICMAMLDSADAVFMLKDWQQSRGATLEHAYAKRVGKTIFYEVPPRRKANEEILKDAGFEL